MQRTCDCSWAWSVLVAPAPTLGCLEISDQNMSLRNHYCFVSSPHPETHYYLAVPGVLEVVPKTLNSFFSSPDSNNSNRPVSVPAIILSSDSHV